jgi:hypothetical protein
MTAAVEPKRRRAFAQPDSASAARRPNENVAPRSRARALERQRERARVDRTAIALHRARAGQAAFATAMTDANP